MSSSNFWSVRGRSSIARLFSGFARIRPYRWTCAALIFCAAVFMQRNAQIDATLPYPQHVDEKALARSAERILLKSDWNPKFFRYPSLPIYGAAVGMAAGAVKAAGRGEMSSLDGLSLATGGPYSHPTVMKVARQMFLAVAIAGLYLSGVLAARVTKRPILRLLAPLILCVSPSFGSSSWTYLNVDIWAATFTLATLTWLACTLHTRGFFAKAFFPALLTAAATTSKYNAALVGLSCLLTIFWFERAGWRTARSLQFAALCVFFFVAFEPYSLLDTRGFLDGVLFEVHHYATGHAQSQSPNVQRGWPHFQKNVGRLYDEYGAALSAFAFVGAASLLRRDWRKALVFLAAPMLSVVFMSQQKVFFSRNLVPALACLPLYSGLGVVVTIEVLRRFAFARPLPPLVQYGVRFGAPALLVGIILAGTTDAWRRFAVQSDSRRSALRWMSKETEPLAAVLIDKRLMVATNSLSHPERARLLSPKGLAEERRIKSDKPRYLLVRARLDHEDLAQAVVGTKIVAKFGSKGRPNAFPDPKLTVRLIPPNE